MPDGGAASAPRPGLLTFVKSNVRKLYLLPRASDGETAAQPTDEAGEVPGAPPDGAGGVWRQAPGPRHARLHQECQVTRPALDVLECHLGPGWAGLDSDAKEAIIRTKPLPFW